MRGEALDSVRGTLSSSCTRIDWPCLTLVFVLRSQGKPKVCSDARFPFLQVDSEGTETQFAFKMDFVLGLSLLIAVFTTCLISIEYQFYFQSLRIQL